MSGSSIKKYTLKEIEEHNSNDSVWLLIENGIYDVSKFLDEHPGGSEPLLEWAGKDATDAFEDIGHSADARALMANYKIGELSEEEKKKKKENGSSCFKTITEAGKDLLRNTINTVKFHNRILEENEMWKQWELERGLTMMVSDDLILKRIKKEHKCSKHRKKSKSQSIEHSEKTKRSINVASTSREDSDKWDHSGFAELYPNKDPETYTSSNKTKKWDHSGFLELYPEEAEKYKFSKCKESFKKWDHDGFLELYPEEAEKYKSSKPSLKKSKKKKKKHVKESSSDTEIWEEFKSFKRQKKSKT